MSQALLDAFRARAEKVGSVVRELDDWRAVGRLALELADRSDPDARVAVPPALATAQPGLVETLGQRALLVDASDVPAVADAPVGIMAGERLIAETGSVLVTEDLLADRAVSMLSRILLQVAPMSALVASLDDAADWLADRSRADPTDPASRGWYGALVSGPSRTADIERSLTIGVQGPMELYVVVLGREGDA